MQLGAPVILLQPAGRSHPFGATVVLTVVVGGTAPLNYQWWKDGVPLPEATEPSLSLVKGDSSGSGWFVENVAPLLYSPRFLTESFGFLDGQFGFTLSGPPGQEVIIEASGDLENWTPIWTDSLGEGPIFWSDPESATRPQRFYRLRY